MKLKEYIAKERVNLAEFSLLIGVNVSTLYRYMREENSPSAKKAKLIEKVTGGKVTASELRGCHG